MRTSGFNLFIVVVSGGCLACGILACSSGTATPNDKELESEGDGEVCQEDEACSDGLFCNGEEKCDPMSADAGNDGCVVGATECESAGRCLEDKARCADPCSEEPDADGDGHDAVECGGDDCDDGDPDRYPTSTEVCDDEGHDEDCDETTFGSRDADKDGYVDVHCCNSASSGDICGDDCNDQESGMHPSEAENCDGLDNDCDGDIDEGFECILGSPAVACTTASGLSGTRECSPTCTLDICTAPEVCNGLDDNKDPESKVDDGFLCPQNAANIACTTACGTSGTGTCNSECTAFESCVTSSEVCNYCDDNGVSGITEEKPMATYSSVTSMSDGYTALGLAEQLEPTPYPGPGVYSDFYWQLTPGAENFEVGGVRFAEGSHMGWKGVEVEVLIQVYGPPAPEFGPEPNYGGWGISLVTDSQGLGSTYSGGVSGALGFEWTWGHQDLYSGYPVEGDAPRLHGVTKSITTNFGAGSIPGPAQEQSDAWTTQRLYLKYTPDDPSTGADEEALLVKNGKDGTQILAVAGTGGTYELYDEVKVGETFAVMVSAASYGRPFKAKLLSYTLYIDSFYYETEYTEHALVAVDGLCPP